MPIMEVKSNAKSFGIEVGRHQRAIKEWGTEKFCKKNLEKWREERKKTKEIKRLLHQVELLHELLQYSLEQDAKAATGIDETTAEEASSPVKCTSLSPHLISGVLEVSSLGG